MHSSSQKAGQSSVSFNYIPCNCILFCMMGALNRGLGTSYCSACLVNSSVRLASHPSTHLQWLNWEQYQTWFAYVYATEWCVCLCLYG